MNSLVAVALLAALAAVVAQLPPDLAPGPHEPPPPPPPRPQVPAPGPGPSSLHREATFQIHAPWARSAIHKSQDIIRPEPVPVDLVVE
ncbi:uncharacterized proline-rich protein-like [Schistocerca gregaria]|uniref:uncharacterized proline-rich protein-like n=1 Tax=Schistocerca gregaria TaxID=7010 RepID=UPI00211E572A|nr:uncharacterized proline-rich protein-like [Schistocerca gregaria]